MTDLGGDAIHEQFQTGNWKAWRGERALTANELDPLIGPNSMDVTLHPKLLIPVGGQVISPTDVADIEYREVMIDTTFKLMPGQFLLASVQERVECDNPVDGDFYYQCYEGRSTMARLGMVSHLSAGLGDYGFKSAYTAEIRSMTPNVILLHPGMRIGQLVFRRVLRPRMYRGAYSGSHHNDGPVGPKTGPGRA